MGPGFGFFWLLDRSRQPHDCQFRLPSILRLSVAGVELGHSMALHVAPLQYMLY